MQGVQLSPVILQDIISRISQLYITNEDATEFLERHDYKIPLHQYLCFTYGMRDSNRKQTRIVEALYFNAKNGSGKRVRYEISLFNRADETYRTFWIAHTTVLRKDILGFTDKTHLFRNTFLYDPFSLKIYRMHELKEYLHLPQKSLLNTPVWTSLESFELTTAEAVDEETCIVPSPMKWRQIKSLERKIIKLKQSL